MELGGFVGGGVEAGEAEVAGEVAGAPGAVPDDVAVAPVGAEGLRDEEVGVVDEDGGGVEFAVAAALDVFEEAVVDGGEGGAFAGGVGVVVVGEVGVPAGAVDADFLFFSVEENVRIVGVEVGVRITEDGCEEASDTVVWGEVGFAEDLFAEVVEDAGDVGGGGADVADNVLGEFVGAVEHLAKVELTFVDVVDEDFLGTVGGYRS